MNFLYELLTLMTLVKMGTVILITVILSVVAEAVSPRIAGILTGFPLGAAISIFFMGFEISPAFAAESALHTSAGISATITFAYCYYTASVLAKGLNCTLQIFAATIAGLLGYCAAIFLLHFVPAGFAAASVLPVASIFLFIRLFRKIENVKIEKRVSVSPALLLLRAFFAACSVVLIISTAKIVGPTWAGLFAAFPNILLPLVVIIQFTYMPEHAYVIIKNVPKGLASVVTFCLTVSLTYGDYGIYLGTVLGYMTSIIYLVVIQFGRDLLLFAKKKMVPLGML
ncbi:MAG: hypothetical protein AAGU11_02655 [Syntrophobacteraceae bacterium]